MSIHQQLKYFLNFSPFEAYTVLFILDTTSPFYSAKYNVIFVSTYPPIWHVVLQNIWIQTVNIFTWWSKICSAIPLSIQYLDNYYRQLSPTVQIWTIAASPWIRNGSRILILERTDTWNSFELNSSILVSWAIICYHSSSLWICYIQEKIWWLKYSVSDQSINLNELEETHFHLTFINYHYDYKGEILLFLFSIRRKWSVQLWFQDKFRS